MKKLLFAIICMAAWTQAAAAKDIYIAQTSAGTNSGADCADALAWSAFGVSGNWVAGNTLHICGTYTGMAGATAITTAGSGSSGSPITIKFETGALLTAPYWAGNSGGTRGAIVCQNSYITIDGGTNGEIENTANGTNLTYQQPTAGVVSSSVCANFTVKNLAIHNLYIMVYGPNDSADGSNGIFVGGNYSLVTGNTVDHAAVGVFARGCTSNVEFSHNTTSFNNWGMGAGNGGGQFCNADSISIHDNDIGGNNGTYDGTGGTATYHQNGIMVFSDCSGTCSTTNLKIYNNFIHGIWSEGNSHNPAYPQQTAHVFLDTYDTPGIIGALVFNNIFELDAGDAGTANSLVTANSSASNLTSTRANIYNNTFVQNNGSAGSCIAVDTSSTVENNIFDGCGYSITVGPGTGGGVIDYNLYYNTVAPWKFPGYATGTFSAWRTSGYDTHGYNGVNPGLSSTTTVPMAISTSSPPTGVGVNLTNLGIAQLNSDKAGTPRSATGPWTLGAFAPSANSNLAPATGLNAVGH